MQALSECKNKDSVLWASALITVFFQLYEAGTITRWGENGYSEMEEVSNNMVNMGDWGDIVC